MEYLDEVDRNNNFTGRILPKEEFHLKGFYYREVIGFVVNEQGEILLQKRASTKKIKPNLWEVCYGHVSKGETPDESIIREIGEEIGLEITSQEAITVGIELTEEFYEERYHNTFSYIFLIRTDKKISNFKMQEEEVSALKYVSIQELKVLLKNSNELAFSNFEYMDKIIKKIEEIIKI